jgi:hypothetical protein
MYKKFEVGGWLEKQQKRSKRARIKHTIRCGAEAEAGRFQKHAAQKIIET